MFHCLDGGVAEPASSVALCCLLDMQIECLVIDRSVWCGSSSHSECTGLMPRQVLPWGNRPAMYL